MITLKGIFFRHAIANNKHTHIQTDVRRIYNMVIEPRTRQFISTTAHPDGCNEHVRRQIEYVKAQGPIESEIKNVLIIGSSTGYGLSTKIAAAYGLGANTMGVHFERAPRGKRTASAGYYNNEAWHAYAEADGHKTVSINGDAFSQEIKDEVVAQFKALSPGEQFDAVIYSIASPRRTDQHGDTYTSVIKPVGETYESKSLNMDTNEIVDASIEPATDEEVAATVKVMGGEDWELWINFLDEQGVLAEGALTLAFSYIGPDLTQAIYTSGSIGKAKDDLYATADRLREHGYDNAYVSINKAVVTQASVAIPSIGLYISALFKVMKEQGSHEDTIEQMYRLFAEKFDENGAVLDENELIRLDDWEMADKVQEPVYAAFEEVSTETVDEHLDLKGFWDDFYKLYGFGFDNVDYTRDVDLETELGGYVGPR